MLRISARNFDPFRKLRLLWMWDKGMDINPEDETSYTTQYQEARLMYVENEYCAKHQCVPVNKPGSIPSSNLIPSAKASGSSQSSFDTDDLFSDEEGYLTSNNVAESTPRGNNWAACVLSAARLYLNPLPESPKHWEQINPNLNNYHSGSMVISSPCWIPDITDWWHQQKQTH